MAAAKSSDYLSYGITFLLYGVFLLLDKIGIIHKIPYAGQITSSGAFFLIAAIIFLVTQPNRFLSWIFFITAILLNAGVFLSQTTIYFYLIAPVGLIITGVVMLLISKKN